MFNFVLSIYLVALLFRKANLFLGASYFYDLDTFGMILLGFNLATLSCALLSSLLKKRPLVIFCLMVHLLTQCAFNVVYLPIHYEGPQYSYEGFLFLYLVINHLLTGQGAREILRRVFFFGIALAYFNAFLEKVISLDGISWLQGMGFENLLLNNAIRDPLWEPFLLATPSWVFVGLNYTALLLQAAGIFVFWRDRYFRGWNLLILMMHAGAFVFFQIRQVSFDMVVIHGMIQLIAMRKLRD